VCEHTNNLTVHCPYCKEFPLCQHGHDTTKIPCPDCSGMGEYGPSLYWRERAIRSESLAKYWLGRFMELLGAKKEDSTACKGLHEMPSKKDGG